MASNQTSDEMCLSSNDLRLLITSGNEIFDRSDLDNSLLAEQLLQFRQPQSVPAASQISVPRTTRPRPQGAVHSTSTSLPGQGPYVEIIEQPRARGLRFRYECEGRSAGSIPGETSTPERKTFPAIKIHNYNGPAVIVVSCVTKEEPYKPHPHNLVGKDCKKGVCTLRIRDTNTVSFPHLGIQCAKKKDVDGNLKMRQDINVDPFQTGFKHKTGNIDLNVVRLCFQVFLPDEQGKITRIVPPVVSQAIHDKKALNDLVICRIDRTSGKPKGGDEVFLLCEKINKDDARVRFYEERDGQCIWEAFGDFGQNDVHRQYAIVFKTPAYQDVFLTQPKDVFMQLQRSSDLEGSDSITFTYQPEDPDPDRILEKRKRKAASLNFLQESGSTSISQETLKQRLKLKATRTAGRVKPEPVVKEEVMIPELPQYAYNNIGTQRDVSSAVMQSTNLMPNHMNHLDMSGTITTEASQNLQYTPITSQDMSNPVPSVTLNTQLLQLLAATGMLSALQPATYQPVQQQVMHPNPEMLQLPHPDQSVQQMELVKLLLAQFISNQQNQMQMASPQMQTASPQMQMATPHMQMATPQMQMATPQMQTATPQMQTGNPQMPILTNNDPNMQSQNQDMNSLGSFDPNLLQHFLTGDSPMISFESLESLSGNLNDLSYHPNVAGFETVASDMQGSQEQLDEINAAVRNLH